jgi:hypothetical protein
MQRRTSWHGLTVPFSNPYHGPERDVVKPPRSALCYFDQASASGRAEEQLSRVVSP